MSVPRAGVVFRPAARRDIRSILVYTARRWGSAQRSAYEEAINRALATLSTNPEIGRTEDEILPGLRSFRVEQHVIFYQVDGKGVLVIRVLHGSMDASIRLIGL